MTRVARKKMHRGDVHLRRKWKTKRRGRDLDQIHADMSCPEAAAALLNQPVEQDLPGQGQNYCLHCAKHFISVKAMKDHFRSKPHKRRIKSLQTTPYTSREAESAAGLGRYVRPEPVSVQTQGVEGDGGTGETTPGCDKTGETTPDCDMTGETTPDCDMTGETTPDCDKKQVVNSDVDMDR